MDGHGIEPRVFACWGLSHRLLACPRDRYSAGDYWWWWRGQMNENDEEKKKETMLPLFLLFFCVCGETADSLLSRTSTEHCTCNYCTCNYCTVPVCRQGFPSRSTLIKKECRRQMQGLWKGKGRGQSNQWRAGCLKLCCFESSLPCKRSASECVTEPTLAGRAGTQGCRHSERARGGEEGETGDGP
jgi:hypothetical protein